jgi:hypothetical protein
MRYNIKVIANSKENKVYKENDFLKIYLKTKPLHGEANQALIGLLADYFNVSKSRIRIIKGEKTRRKIIDII